MADLLYNAVIEKITGEQFDEEFEFEGFIPEDTTVSSHVVTVTRADGEDVTEDVVVESSHATTIVTVTLKTLTTDTSYLIKVTVTASDLTPSAQVKLMNVTAPGVFR